MRNISSIFSRNQSFSDKILISFILKRNQSFVYAEYKKKILFLTFVNEENFRSFIKLKHKEEDGF